MTPGSVKCIIPDTARVPLLPEVVDVMSQSHSVTHWIEQLKAGEGSDAQQQLWNRYFRRLVRLADKQLGDTPRRVADQEDVALNALSSFFEGVGEGAFPQLKDVVVQTVRSMKQPWNWRIQGMEHASSL